MTDFIYTERTTTTFDEFEPDPDEEDFENEILPIEIDRWGRLVFRYYTNEELSKRDKKYKRIADALVIESPKQVEWADGEFEDLYGRESPDRVKNPNIAKNRPSQPPQQPPPPLPPSDEDTGITYQEEFHLKPGDVLVFSSARYTHTGKCDQVPEMRSFINIHHDPDYFKDNGQYRVNFVDKYGPLLRGDFVIRFGNFNRSWLWNRHFFINFYMYIPNCNPNSDPKERPNDQEPCLHPWYWLDRQLIQSGGNLIEPNAIVNPINPTTPINIPVLNFRLRDGDIVINYIDKGPIELPDHKRIQAYVWNPLLASIGEKLLVNHNDRVVRHGMDFKQWRVQNQYGHVKYTQTANIYVELYYYRKREPPEQGADWIFLGCSQKRFCDHLLDHSRKLNKIKRTQQVPLVGDILFKSGLRFVAEEDPTKRKGPTRGWQAHLKIGGLVSFHIWELLKDYGREPRPFIRFTDVGKYGQGNTSMVLRFGKFLFDPIRAPPTSNWEWKERRSVELFILNTRGSSWRRCAIEYWPHELQRPLPNYSWQPYNEHNLQEVSPDFQPMKGDIIIHTLIDHDWVNYKSNPGISGSSYNAHYDIDVALGIFGSGINEVEHGDFLVRAGYETNHINKSWTNATVELYYLDGMKGDTPLWSFQGRDAYIFGTNFWNGGLSGVQESGFGDLSVSDVETLNSFDRNLFIPPREGAWREQSINQALRL